MTLKTWVESLGLSTWALAVCYLRQIGSQSPLFKKLKLFTCGIFIDLKKAFDTVDHTILLQKLDHYGIRGIINDWFSSYLLGRSQVTEVDTYLSSKSQISCGVSQGSVLGPLLFLIYINDIHNSSDKLSFYLFADDTNLLYADRNLKSLEETVNNELLKVSEWLNANKLTFNAKKSNYVIFRPYQRKLGYSVNMGVARIFQRRGGGGVTLTHTEGTHQIVTWIL